jgi:hypothetical protein
MGRIEDCVVLHAQACQIVNIEKQTEINLVLGHPPERQPVNLRLNQSVELIETV